MNSGKTKAEERFARLKHQEETGQLERRKAEQAVAANMARQRALRLAKEAVDKEEADRQSAEKAAAKAQKSKKAAAKRKPAAAKKAAEPDAD